MSLFKVSAVVSVALLTLGCVVIPVSHGKQSNQCEISSDKKTLRIIDVAEETNTYYSISGIILTPILVPTSAIISGSYVAVNNIYHIGEKQIKCG